MRHSDTRRYQAVVTTFDVGMILVARNQYEVMATRLVVAVVQWNTGRCTNARNLPTLVDLLGNHQVQCGVRWNQGVQINYGSVFPKSGSDGCDS